jgi:hypothetical protein
MRGDSITTAGSWSQHAPAHDGSLPEAWPLAEWLTGADEPT